MFTLTAKHAQALTKKPLDTVRTIDAACKAAVWAAATSGLVLAEDVPVSVGSGAGTTYLRLVRSDDHRGAWTLTAEGADGGLSVHVALTTDFSLLQPTLCW